MSFNLNTDKNKKVHFIGIGGVSMSGLAAVLLTKGYKVSGSDAKESEVLNKLRKSGAEIYIGHNKNNIKNVDLIVYTAAIPASNPEIIEAKEKSGTLITVDFALEQGRDVFVVPGNINSINSVGTNDLIRQGAKIVTSYEDVE